ncbi:hypothetical protein GCM10020366_06140 [Saccharopolyspora gregorii]|uniref:Uncharacterized protein n=1 Tax=Saccharopolyspora gregorii TaxID=33914 RepID=A0ABP6RJP3_9PSEU
MPVHPGTTVGVRLVRGVRVNAAGRKHPDARRAARGSGRAEPAEAIEALRETAQRSRKPRAVLGGHDDPLLHRSHEFEQSTLNGVRLLDHLTRVRRM